MSDMTTGSITFWQATMGMAGEPPFWWGYSPPPTFTTFSAYQPSLVERFEQLVREAVEKDATIERLREEVAALTSELEAVKVAKP